MRRRIRILVDELVDARPAAAGPLRGPRPSTSPTSWATDGSAGAAPAPRSRRSTPGSTSCAPGSGSPGSLGPAADRSLGRQVARRRGSTRAAATPGVGQRRLVRPVRARAPAGRRSTTSPTTGCWPRWPPARRPGCGPTTTSCSTAAAPWWSCSPDLARTRGARPCRRPDPQRGRPRPLPHAAGPARPSCPDGPVAVYVGTLHDERIDVALLVALAEARPDLQIALVGPDSLGPETSARLAAVPTVHLLGAQPYDRVPGFLQHADVVVIPHLVNPFTESLDPIKAYECLAAGRPTVATPVAGFRGLGPPVVVRDRCRVRRRQWSPCSTPLRGEPAGPGRRPRSPRWRERAEAMLAVMAPGAQGRSRDRR